MITAIFVVWWAISACNQFRAGAWTRRLRQHIPLGLIPLWTFFAPNPARTDSRLIWREEGDGEWDGWQEVHLGFAPGWKRWLVNPELILNKAIADLVNSLRLSQTHLDRSVVLSSAYVALLSIVLNQRRRAGSLSIQFAILRTATGIEGRRVDVAFVSEIHDVCGLVTHVC